MMKTEVASSSIPNDFLFNRNKIWILDISENVDNLEDRLSEANRIAGMTMSMESIVKDSLEVVFGAYPRNKLNYLDCYSQMVNYNIPSLVICEILLTFIDRMHEYITQRTGAYPSANTLVWELVSIKVLVIKTT